MKKEIPVKNYVILVIIFLVTIVAVFYVRDWYNTTKEHYAQNSVMTKVIREINSDDEISNYILENQRLILYVSSGQNSEIKNFEDDFKDLIQKLDLRDEVIYMNLDNVDANNFYDLLKNKFARNSKIKNQLVSSEASLYLFIDGKVTDVLNNVDNYSMKRLESIIESWDISNA